MLTVRAIGGMGLTVLALAALSGCGRGTEGREIRERADGIYRQAMADYTAGRVEQAIEGFSKVARESPANASARFQLACLLQDVRKDYFGALCNYREYLQQAADSEKAPIAKDRFEECERLYAPVLARRMNLADNAALAEANERLEKSNASFAAEVKSLRARLEQSESRGERLAREAERLRKALSSDDGEGSESAPVLDVSERDLLDDDEGVNRVSIAADVSRLRLEEREEVVAAPFGPSGRAADRVAKPKADEPLHEKRPPTYVVVEGDTLSKIALRFYGVKSAWKRIRDANKAIITTDGRVRIGMRIVLPE